MKEQRPARAVGTYGLLDVVRGRRQPWGLAPDPRESLGDVAAVRRGESRVVACHLRRLPGRWSPGPRMGQLEIRADGASWRPWPALGRRSRALDVTAVVLVRPAAGTDIRLTGPGNFHLFTLIRCATSTGHVDLLVPTADVPLVTWRLGGEQAMPHDLARAARRPPPPPGAALRRAAGAAAAIGIGSALAMSGLRFLATLAFVISAQLLASAVVAHLRRRRDRLG